MTWIWSAAGTFGEAYLLVGDAGHAVAFAIVGIAVAESFGGMEAAGSGDMYRIAAEVADKLWVAEFGADCKLAVVDVHIVAAVARMTISRYRLVIFSRNH